MIMPSHVPFDTLAFAKKLEARGVDAKHAEAHAEVLAETFETTILTKHENEIADNKILEKLNQLEQKMQVRFTEIEQNINGKFAEVNVRFAALEQDMNGKFAEVNGRFAEVKGEFAEIYVRFAALEQKMNVKFAEIDAKFAEMKYEIIKWVFGISFAQAALIISVLKFFH